MRKLFTGVSLALVAFGICSASHANETQSDSDVIRAQMAEMDFEREKCRGDASIFLHDVCAGITKAQATEQMGEPIKCQGDFDPEGVFSFCQYSRVSGAAGGFTTVYFLLDRAFKISMFVPNTNEFNRGMGDSFAKAWAEHLYFQKLGSLAFRDGDDYMYYDPLSEAGEKKIHVTWGSEPWARAFDMYP